MRSTGGAGAAVSEDDIIGGIQLLAETEGIFTEPAGGVTVAATRQLIERGAIPRDESIVICITGNGFKTADVLEGKGKWGADDAEVWQVRRKHPTSKDHGTTSLVLAALRLPATDEVRRGLLAGLASLVVE